VTTFAAVLACTLLGALAVFQVLLVLGAPLGRFAWGGQHRVLPTRFRVGSIVSVLIYALLAVLVLARAGLVETGVSDGFLRTTTWIVVAYFFLGIGMNLASRSKPERAVMSPVAAVLCALCAVVAIG
jgi:predicted permease